MHPLLYAALMGFAAAAPVGAVGAACAMAAMEHRLKDTFRLITGVMLGDAIVVTTVNTILFNLPHLNMESLKSWPIWWVMTFALTGYGIALIARPQTMGKSMVYPKRPFWLAFGWTVGLNAKNWLGTFALYAGWHLLGLTTTLQNQIAVIVMALLGGLAAWLLWVWLCWHARKWHNKAEFIAQRLVGILCLLAALSAAVTLLIA